MNCIESFDNKKNNFLCEKKIIKIMGAAWLSRAVSVAARLGIADALEVLPLSLEELSSQIGCHAQALACLIHMLTCFEIFQYTKDGRIENSDISEHLRSKHLFSLRNYCIFAGEEYYQAWLGLEETIKTGKSGFEQVFGCDLYSYLERYKDTAATYDIAMEDLSRRVAHQLAEDWGSQFKKGGHVVDIGGGQGIISKQLVTTYPELVATVIDRNEVCVRASKRLKPSFASRIRFIAGDFFKKINIKADFFILKNVLHNWDKQSCRCILANISEAMKAQKCCSPSRLFVIEPLIEKNEILPRLVVNALFQIVICQEGARPRNIEEMRNLLEEQGLKIIKVTRLVTSHTVIEACLG